MLEFVIELLFSVVTCKDFIFSMWFLIVSKTVLHAFKTLQWIIKIKINICNFITPD